MYREELSSKKVDGFKGHFWITTSRFATKVRAAGGRLRLRSPRSKRISYQCFFWQWDTKFWNLGMWETFKELRAKEVLKKSPRVGLIFQWIGWWSATVLQFIKKETTLQPKISTINAAKCNSIASAYKKEVTFNATAWMKMECPKDGYLRNTAKVATLSA